MRVFGIRFVSVQSARFRLVSGVLVQSVRHCWRIRLHIRLNCRSGIHSLSVHVGSREGVLGDIRIRTVLAVCLRRDSEPSQLLQEQSKGIRADIRELTGFHFV